MSEAAPTGRLLRRGFAVIAAEVRLHPVTFALAVTGAGVYAGMTVASSWAVGRIVDRVVVPRFEDGEVATGTVVAALGLLVLIGIVKAAGIVTRRTFASITQFSIQADLREGLVRHYGRQPLSFHRSRPTGELLAHASADAEAATEVLAPLPYSTGVVVMLVVSAVWLLRTDPWLALAGFLLLPALVLLNGRYQHVVEVPATVAQQRVGLVTSVAHESFDGALVVKALGREGEEAARFAAEAGRLRDAKVRVARIRAAFDATLDAVPALLTVVLVVVGAWRLDRGAVTAGDLVAFVNLFQLLVWPLRLFGYLLGEMPRSVVGWDRIQRVLAVPAPPSRVGGTHLPAGPLDVSVDDLTFAFGEQPVLDGIRFRIEPGATVAVVGPTGTGKSTLVLLLARLLDPTGGRVLLGGVDVAGLDHGELEAAVSIVFQEPFLFDDTVAGNVTLGAEIDDDEVWAALRLAGADRFVAELDGGLRAVLGERGATLSGGQRQRLALARALARRPRVLLLDDATSAVDPTTEAGILAGLGEHLVATTTLVVANRPSTIAVADRVLYLEHGRLAGDGTHAELLATVPGYERLVTAYERERAGL